MSPGHGLALIFKLLENRDDPAVVSRCLGVVKTHCESPETALPDLVQLLVLHCDTLSSAAACTVALAGIEVLSLRIIEPHTSRQIVIETHLMGHIAPNSSDPAPIQLRPSSQQLPSSSLCSCQQLPAAHCNLCGLHPPPTSRQELIPVFLSNVCWLGFK